MRIMRYAGVVAVLAVALVMSACQPMRALEAGAEAPGFTLNDADGNPVSLAAFKGKVIIVDFFASWCPPCRQEIPDFIELQRAYGAQGFTMMGVSLVSAAETKNFAAKTGINYPVVIDDGAVSASWGPVRSIPTTFVIDKNFNIAKVYIGYRPKDVFENDIKELLK